MLVAPFMVLELGCRTLPRGSGRPSPRGSSRALSAPCPPALSVADGRARPPPSAIAIHSFVHPWVAGLHGARPCEARKAPRTRTPARTHAHSDAAAAGGAPGAGGCWRRWGGVCGMILDGDKLGLILGRILGTDTVYEPDGRPPAEPKSSGTPPGRSVSPRSQGSSLALRQVSLRLGESPR